ncbi:MAG: D-alanine--D-alanine ligase family protein [Trueperaceae bacterium]|nr:D-alanine--D-alanine ligase family protein [Trueperaceae bacterium]
MSATEADTTAAGRPVLLLCGGPSDEHAVSLASAASLLQEAGTVADWTPRVLRRDGRGLLSPDASRAALRAAGGGVPPAPARPAPDPTPRLALLDDLAAALRDLVARADAVGATPVVLPLLHGPGGEDGRLQGLLDAAGVAYVGAGVRASAVAMDKIVMKQVLAAADVPQVAWRAVHRDAVADDPEAARAHLADLPWPRFVKPANLGSSVGIARVRTAAEQDAALDDAFRHDPRGVVEAAAEGARELEVAVLDGRPPDASPVGEVVVPGGAFYDYAHKYAGDATELRVPAPLDAATADAARALALRAFDALGLEGLARVDLFLGPDGALLVNEVNTLPGFTARSMYPRLWHAGGLPYPALVARLLDLAVARPPG